MLGNWIGLSQSRPMLMMEITLLELGRHNVYSKNIDLRSLLCYFKIAELFVHEYLSHKSDAFFIISLLHRYDIDKLFSWPTYLNLLRHQTVSDVLNILFMIETLVEIFTKIHFRNKYTIYYTFLGYIYKFHDIYA